MGMLNFPSFPVVTSLVTAVVSPLGYVTVTFAPAYALPLLSASSADALILPNGIVVAIINAIINHAAILFPFVLQNISIF